MSAPSVYAAINAITDEFSKRGIPKNRANEFDDYKYRSIDDVLDRLAPLLAKHRLCALPQTAERTVVERTDDQGRLLFHVAVRVSLSLTSVDDGSSHTVECYGEALDAGDKATAKAASAAYKCAMVQSFCIPLCGTEDVESTSHRPSSKSHSPEPPQGWRQWCLDIEDVVGLCETEHAIALVQERNRDLLKALARERADLYAEAGQAFVSRREVLAERTRAANNGKAAPSSRKKSGADRKQVEHG